MIIFSSICHNASLNSLKAINVIIGYAIQQLGSHSNLYEMYQVHTSISKDKNNSTGIYNLYISPIW